jgi:hypothetical protein
MNLTPPQISRFWREWSSVIRYQRWRGVLTADQIDCKRKELLARAGFLSLTQVDKRAGFDRVLTELRAMQDDVERTVEAADDTIADGRRYRALITLEIIPCLALYEMNPMDYLVTVISGLVRWNKIDQPERPPTLDDLDARPTFKTVDGKLEEGPSQLEQAMMTLNARLHAKRREKIHSIHTMKIMAGVKCSCKLCRERRKRVKNEPTPVVPSCVPSTPKFDPKNAPF